MKRKQQFMPADSKHISREAVLEKIFESQTGTNPRIYERIIRSFPKIQHSWERRGRTREEALTAQALMLSRLACEYADHGIKGLRKNGILEDKGILKSMKIDPADPNKAKKAWEYYYNGIIECFSKDPRIPNRGEVHDRMVEIDRFSGMSEKLHELRARHWKELAKIEGRVIGQGQDPEKNLLAEAGRIISRPRKEYEGKVNISVVRGRALDICLAVSIYADIMEKAKGMEWPTAYTEGMLKVHPLLKDKPELVHAIAEIE